ncbi:MAG: response regulator, partial [Planctomycetes bacterium]|nr:response regulator [Planctomycetota bacterium]
ISFLDELKKGFVEAKELVLKTNIGKVIHVAAFITCTRNIHGQINGAQGILYDITNRKRAQVTLNEAHEELKDVNKKLEEQNAALNESRASAIKLIKISEEANAETENANKRLEASIEQANKMAKESILANKSKSDFLANMSHEIRTPMNSIIGFSDILSEENITDEQKNYVNMIRDSGRNLLQLINDILDFSKIEAGKLDTEIIDCSINDILSNIESMMKPAAKNKEIEFKIVYETKIPKMIKTDPTRLHQCLVNLINNAVKFTQNGHVHTFVSFHKSQKKHWLRFRVEDTGIGIEESMCKNIFESFSQADSSTTRKFGGTGLGLAITKSLTELLGGSINVSSKSGKGSVFTIEIPAVVNSDVALDDDYGPTDKEKISENEIQSLSGKVLVAEDNKSNQKLIELILNKIGIHPIIVEDGRKAVEIHKNEKFDLIIMDIQMPKMNGYEATEAIRKTDSDIPVVAITANAMKGDAEKCFNAGCTEYLPKPIKHDKLYEILEKYLKKTDSPEQTKQNTKIDPSDETSSRATPDNSDQTLIAISKFDDDPEMSDTIKIFLSQIIDMTDALEHAAKIKDMPLLKALIEQLTIGSERAGFTDFTEKIKQTETNIAGKPENIELKIQALKNLAWHIVDNQKVKSL